MVKSKSITRLSSIEQVILAQTDTTVGFISQSSSILYKVKSRDTSKQFIKTFRSLKDLSLCNHRIPPSQRNVLRRLKKTTFIIKNKAIRIADISQRSQISRDLRWNYSTSANESGKSFNLHFCEEKADIIIQDKYGLCECSSSSLIKINNIKKVKLR